MLLSALVFTSNNGKAQFPTVLIKGNIYPKRKNLSILGVPTNFEQITKIFT